MCKKLFSNIRTREIHYENVSTYQELMNKVIRQTDETSKRVFRFL